MATNETAVLYLEKDRLFFYDGKKIFKLDFAADTVRDLDIINEDALISLIFQFIDTAKPIPAKFLFVLSESVLFTNEIMVKDPAEIDVQFENFVALVPFNQVHAKKYQVTGGIRMVAANAELINAISDSFEQKGFQKDGVVPAAVFGQIGVKRGLDVDTADFILQNQEMTKGRSMVEPALPVPRENVFKVTTTGKSKSLPYLIAVFALALLAMIALIIFRK